MGKRDKSSGSPREEKNVLDQFTGRREKSIVSPQVGGGNLIGVHRSFWKEEGVRHNSMGKKDKLGRVHREEGERRRLVQGGEGTFL